mgnify:FL=1
MIPYFAYGSNMSAGRMMQRLGWSPRREGAVLQDYLLVFDQPGFNESHWSPANIRSEEEGLVEGIVYHLEERDLGILDGYEKYYRRKDVEVALKKGGTIRAVTYLSEDAALETLPTREYLDFLLEGRGFLSSNYFSMLQSIRTVDQTRTDDSGEGL